MTWHYKIESFLKLNFVEWLEYLICTFLKGFFSPQLLKMGLSEEICKIPPGMGIEFKELTSNDSEMLRTYITELLTKDIIKEQDEPIIKKYY